jgi:hypothetical protein
LFVLSGRKDLAGLAYCSALSRGHSLAAVTLLDLPDLGLHDRRLAEAALGEVVKTGVLQRVRSVYPKNSLTETIARLAGKLESDMAEVSFSRLVELSREHRRRRVGNRALQRILLMARSATALRGFARVGYDAASLKLIHDVSSRVSSEITETVRSGRYPRAQSVLDYIWSVAGRELDGARPRSRAPGPPDKVRQSGAVVRYGRAFTRLPEDHRRVIALRICGATELDIAATATPEAATRVTVAEVREIFAAGTSRLRYEQRGEQYDPLLWSDVDSAFPTELAQQFKELMNP